MILQSQIVNFAKDTGFLQVNKNIAGTILSNAKWLTKICGVWPVNCRISVMVTQQRLQKKQNWWSPRNFLLANNDDPSMQINDIHNIESHTCPHIYLSENKPPNHCVICLFFSELVYSYKCNLNFVKHKIK